MKASREECPSSKKISFLTSWMDLQSCVTELWLELRRLYIKVQLQCLLPLIFIYYCVPVITFNPLCCTCTHIFCALLSVVTQWRRASSPCHVQVLHTSCCTRRASCLCCDSTGSSQTCPSALEASGFQPSRNTGVYGATGPCSWELWKNGESALALYISLQCNQKLPG